MLPTPPRSTLFPYTTLFRSGHADARAGRIEDRRVVGPDFAAGGDALHQCFAEQVVLDARAFEPLEVVAAGGEEVAGHDREPIAVPDRASVRAHHPRRDPPALTARLHADPREAERAALEPQVLLHDPSEVRAGERHDRE